MRRVRLVPSWRASSSQGGLESGSPTRCWARSSGVKARARPRSGGGTRGTRGGAWSLDGGGCRQGDTDCGAEQRRQLARWRQERRNDRGVRLPLGHAYGAHLARRGQRMRGARVGPAVGKAAEEERGGRPEPSSAACGLRRAQASQLCGAYVSHLAIAEHPVAHELLVALALAVVVHPPLAYKVGGRD